MKIVHYHFETIESTNTWAKEHAVKFESKVLTLVTASAQTAGRGRFKRRWESPANLNIYATFCFFLDLLRSDIGHVPQLLALSTAQILEELGFKPTLKWPNDILLSSKKVGGILCETVLIEKQRCVICGIGLNVNMSLEELQKIDRPATSLLVESDKNYSVLQILELIKNQFIMNLNQFLETGFTKFFHAFISRSFLTKGQRIRFHDNQKIVEGYFNHFNLDGSISLQLLNGDINIFHAGEFL
jgi:BirA family biotin operon repressor/biotin-[acetyl-CoA-carboxylase] ligase